MIRINLLPFRAARSKENIRRQVSVFLLSLMLLVLILGAVNGYLGGKVEALEARLENLKAEVKVYEEKARQVEAFKAQLAELNKKIEIVNQLKENRKAPPLLLSAITEVVVPGRMQLTVMDFTSSTIKLDGLALDNETIAVFMKRLERSGKFINVSLASSKRALISNVEMKQFGITCGIVAQTANEAKQS